MQAIRSTALMLYSVILLGCQPSSSDSAQTSQNIAGRCNASAVQELVGKNASPALLDQARRQSGAAVARILRPGDVVTLEYNAQRLTLTTDESLEVQRIGCG